MFKRKRAGFSFVMSCAMVVGSLAAALPAQAATTIIISPGQSIQQAMDSLKNQGCGTLILKPGTYTVGYSVNVYNGCTIQGESATDRPIIQLAAGKDEPVITNASVPFSNVAARNLVVKGGLSASEQNLPEYFHKGSTQYNDRISSGAETQASLDARIEAARLNVIGIDFSDKHNDVSNTGATIDNVLVQYSAMGINVGRTSNVTIKNSKVEYNGAVKQYYHGLYLSTVDHVVIDKLDASHNVTGMGLKVTDFYDDQTETSISIKNSKFNYNYDRGLTVYHMNNLYVEGNEAHDNQKSGINIIDCQTGTLINNNTYNNPNIANVSYDIWLASSSGFTISGNTYGSKNGF
ncbi:right-handed parallel beta-helix repeat-containing protein [Paenibacillus whitsoniae]|uniref:Right-handed parallel beta-helix repeat-containing protein n=1 Tax=Paenibacillus whitsoniae TaxID=2496558 RepID=A0A3S0A7X5_9BACL|nr:right-handed parallel beta-helix repeat-containing protein [Paenibacillus whitsoniae]RTE04446.1 right-handed parallel beta-helix repeat-containing protein [Paenibacillus whitsoniae]